MVLRGYLERNVDPAERRRLLVTLTERGTATAAVIRQPFEGVDARLRQAVGVEHHQPMRTALMALVNLGDA